MSEATNPGAGEMLREARRAQGLEVDALASMIKVTPAKLEALERGEYDQLPDANFTRALAMTVCRSLKIDPAPVLAALPAAKAIPLAPNKPALNQPFKESRGANLSFNATDSFDLKALLKPQWLAPILLLLASVLVYALPDTIQLPSWLMRTVKPAPQPASAPAAAASVPVLLQASAPEMVPTQAELASVAAAVSSAVPEGAALALPSASGAAVSSPASPVVAPSAPVAAPALASVPSGPLGVTGQAIPSTGAALVLTSRQPAWVEIRDGRGGIVLSRHLKVGETVAVPGVPPFKLHLGNSSGLEVVYQGRAVELASYTRNNVARLELK